MPRDTLSDITADADGRLDVTDLWQQAMDPENERGEVCTAWFRHEDASGYWNGGPVPMTRAYLLGLTIEDGGYVTTYDLERARRALGFAGVSDIEQLHEAAINEGF